jgi:hypothetical protein
VTPEQARTLDALRPDQPIAWLVVYEDGTSCVMRDNTRSNLHAQGAHAVRVPLAPVLPPDSSHTPHTG